MNFSQLTQRGALILSVLQIVIFISGCEAVNDPPKIITFTVPAEVEYGKTVEFKVGADDPEGNPLTYSWEVSAGTLIGSTEPEVQWTAPELPLEELVPPTVVRVHVYVQDVRQEEVFETASITVFSKTYKIVQALVGTYILVSKRVHGARVEETGVLRLTTTTFTREFRVSVGGEVQGPVQVIAGSYELVDPFGTKHGGIHWLTDGEPSPSVATYSWEDERLVIFFPATSTEYVYTREGVDPGDIDPEPMDTGGEPVEITDETFVNKVLNAKLPIVFEFRADWSPFCKQMRPIVDAVAVGSRDTFITARLDIDKNPLTPRAYKVDDIPTYVVFRDGKEVARFAGPMPKPIFLQKILDALK